MRMIRRHVRYLLIPAVLFAPWPSPAFSQAGEEAAVKEKYEVSKEAVEKKLASYTYDLKRLMEEARRNIEKADRIIEGKDLSAKEKPGPEKARREREEAARKEAARLKAQREEDRLLRQAEEDKKRVERQRLERERKAEETEKRKVAREEEERKRKEEARKRKEEEQKRKEEALERRKKEEEMRRAEEEKRRLEKEKARTRLKKKEAGSGGKGLPEEDVLLKEKAGVPAEKPVDEKKASLERARDIYETAMMYYNTGQYDLAQNAFQELILIDPANRQARKYLEKALPPKLKAIEQKKERDIRDALSR